MPPLNSWLEITLRTPFLAAPLLILLVIGLVIGGVSAYRRWHTRIKVLTVEVEKLRNQHGEPVNQATGGESAREAYRHFLYNISHEVSNPLQSIQTNLDNMANCTPDEIGRWQQYHTIIGSELRRLAGLTENLRLLSRLETPSALIKREPVNLKGVIEGVMMAQVETAEARGVRLLYSGPQRPARVLGNRDHLYQVMMNLVDNGIKYTREEGGEVVVSVQDERDRLRVRVIDNGMGISEEDLPNIFDTAYRALDTRRFRRRGSGLGLAIVRRIVEQHGGEIRVQSQPGNGTTFYFDLPLYVPS